MASQQHDTVFPEEDIDDEQDEFHEYEEEEDEEDDDVLVDDEENDLPSASASISIPSVTVAVPGGGLRPPILTPAATTIIFADSTFSSDSKRQRLDQIEEKKPPLVEDSRKLFQRLWTDEDEMELLQGFLDYTTQRGSSHHNDTAQFYDQIKSKLQLDFNKNQLVEKIRRLKKKYRNIVSKMSSGKEFVFKTAHDQATFEISRKIWNNVAPIAGDIAIDDDEINLNPSPNPNLNFTPVILKSEVNSTTRKRSRPRSVSIRSFEKRESNDAVAASNRDRDYLNINLNNPNPNHNHNPNAYATTATVNPAITPRVTTPNVNVNTNAAIHANNYSKNCSTAGNGVAGVIEETVRSCLSPFKELMAGAMGGGLFGSRGSFAMNPLPFQMMNLGFGGGELVDEKWRKQQILELEVYSKRLELVQDQIKTSLDELRSVGGSAQL